MLVGYMRVSTDSDRQVMDLQRDALQAPASMRVTCSRTGPAAAAAIALDWPRRLPSFTPAIAWWSGSWIGSAAPCRIY